MNKYLIFSAIGFIALASTAMAQDFSFDKDLSVGSYGGDVSNLQSWLISNGFDIPSISSHTTEKGYFGIQTQTALSEYQRSVGLPPYGYFGSITRDRLNHGGSMYQQPSNTRAPIINGVDAPTTLTAGQTGTWTIRATDPQNGTLSYSILWGDEPGYAVTGGTTAVPVVMQTNTFTHAYVNAGVYMVTFTVRNSAGLAIQTSSSVQVVSSSTYSATRITSPNGGEVWQKGTTHNITWTSPNYFSAVTADLKLIPYQAPCTTHVCPMYALAPYTIVSGININQNSYSWNVGSYSSSMDCSNCSVPLVTQVPDGQYFVQICQTGTSVCDTSDNTFTVTSNPSGLSSVIVNSPNGGEVWPTNSVHQISWTVSNSPSTISQVDLYLGNSSQNLYTLDKNIAVGSIYNWIVATDISNYPIPAGTYLMRVCAAGSMTNCGTSNNYFTITSSNLVPNPSWCPIGYTCTPNH